MTHRVPPARPAPREQRGAAARERGRAAPAVPRTRVPRGRAADSRVEFVVHRRSPPPPPSTSATSAPPSPPPKPSRRFRREPPRASPRRHKHGAGRKELRGREKTYPPRRHLGCGRWRGTHRGVSAMLGVARSEPAAEAGTRRGVRPRVGSSPHTTPRPGSAAPSLQGHSQQAQAPCHFIHSVHLSLVDTVPGVSQSLFKGSA